MNGPSAPIKKIRPYPCLIPGYHPYFCDVCFIEWLEKELTPSIICPDCKKEVHHESYDKKTA